MLAKELYSLDREQTEKVMKPYQNLLKEAELFRETAIKKAKLINDNLNNNLIKVDECLEVTECIEVTN